MRRDDRTEGIAGIKMPKTKGDHTWTDEEIAHRAYWQLGTQQRLVMEFALETASRRGEVIRFGPQHARNGRIRIDRTHGSEDVDMPMSPELRAACDATPKVHLTYITTNSAKHAEHLKHRLTSRRGGVEALLMQEQVGTCGVDFG